MKLKQTILTSLICAIGVSTAHSSFANTLPNIKVAVIEAMSGASANAGEAVVRNIRFAVERVNAAGGVNTPEGKRSLELMVLDNKGLPEDSLIALKAAVERGAVAVMQGNGSAVASVLSDAVNKHNNRENDTKKHVLFLNYSAVDPALTNERCNPWHFRFDAHVDMRMAALIAQLSHDKTVKKVYLLNQDYSFGQQVAKSARLMIASIRPDIQIVGDDLHPMMKVKDFSPYVAKIKASNADAVVTGNWGNDLTFFVKSAKEAGLKTIFYTFYGSNLGVPAALGEAGVDRVVAVSEWHKNASAGKKQTETDKIYQQYRQRFSAPKDDYFNPRTVLMVDMLVQAMNQSPTIEADAVAKQLSGMRYATGGFDAAMREGDHQLIQPLYVYRMGKQGSVGIDKDVEGSGYGFKTALFIPAQALNQPHSCRKKPW
jgi:branched-chain amino acid transport system substrate-binding protein